MGKLLLASVPTQNLGAPPSENRKARAVRDLAPAHWVQTPYRYFPIEPHWLFPGFQFLPTPLRARADLHWALKKDHPREYDSAVAHVLRVELLDKTQLAFYFPESMIRTERLMGLTKSIIAVKVG